jgi:8-oxo-dGTP pyrophosphatase MutT (NUDIX family)
MTDPSQSVPDADPFQDVPDADLAYFQRMAAEFAGSGRTPSVPRLAATVVIRRPDGAVLLIRRAMGMVFGGRWAFPGGSVDPEDRREGEPEVADAARAAVREVREEVGIDLTGDLIPWSRWVTPEFEPRRFDTYFFVGMITDEEVEIVANGEASDYQWITPADAVAGYLAGELPMLPPTAVTLRELADLATLDDIVTAGALKDLNAPILPGSPPS